MKSWWLLGALLLPGCFKPWSTQQLFACDSAGACADGLTCDDGVCCRPGGTPACPTLPVDGACAGKAPTVYFEDRDNDGFGNPTVQRAFCSPPVRTPWATQAGDCDDTPGTGATVKPTGLEVCNGRDDDCDGTVDDGLNRANWYRDADGDGFGDPSDSLFACAVAPGSGYVAQSGDCFPEDREAFPGARERCNNLDDNCNGQVDEGNFSDAFNEGDPVDAHACATALKGECAAGNTRCQRALNGVYALSCVPRHLPRFEICGDSLDSDCDGSNDNAPGCGGPASLVTATGSYGAVRLSVPELALTSQGLGRCMVPEYRAHGGREMSWLNPGWVSTNTLSPTFNDVAPFEVHVWWLEAPGTETWDLSAANRSLELGFEQVQVGVVDGTGFWGDSGRLKQPLVNLCDENGTLVRQYEPTGGGFAAGSTLPMLPLAGNGDWRVASSAGALSRVKRVELVISSRSIATGQSPTMTLKFTPASGFK